MGQVGDPCDLSWLVFDLSQLGAVMKIDAEHWLDSLKRNGRKTKKQTFFSQR